MDIVFASHTVMGPHFVVGSHHLARNFAAAGHRVVHLSTPITPSHLLGMRTSAILYTRYLAWRAGWRKPGAGAAATGPANLIPMAPLPWRWARPLYRLGLNQLLWTVPSIKGLLGRHGIERPDLLIIDQPFFAGLERRLGARTTLYRATDLYAEMTSDPTCIAAESDILRNSNGWIATSQPVFDHLRRLAPDKPGLLLENGVDTGHFSTEQPLPPEYRSMPGPRLVYAGALDSRFDAATARALALALPDASIVLIGPAEDGVRAALEQGGSLANLHLLGPRPYADLPGYFQNADAGLILLNDHPANDGRSPMKLYEYAAAGLPVVSRATNEIARRGDDFVFLYDDAGGAVDAAARALAQRADLAQSLRRAAVSASWEEKASKIALFANLIEAGRAPADRSGGLPNFIASETSPMPTS
jgi:teichuronic acid biosynthesis glycosyltransferase TuaH